MHELPGESRKRALTDIETPVGTAQAFVELPDGPARGLVALGHGAGGSIDAPDLQAVARAARSVGFAVALVRQPYSVAGRRAPAPAAQLDVAWVSAVTAVSRRFAAGLPIVVGGRSSGARVACRTASESGALGVVALAFPLHPPGRPDKSRAAELEVDVPLIVVQGSRDPFGDCSQFPAGVTVYSVDAADHRLAGRGLSDAVTAISGWLTALVPAPAAGRRRAGTGIDGRKPAL